MKAVTAEQMQAIDRTTIERYGIPDAVLMGNAGTAIADIIGSRWQSGARIAVFCGTGNNGGDGFVIGYLLHNRGFSIDIFITGDPVRISTVSAIYLGACRACGISISEIRDAAALTGIDASRYTLFVDALLGTGFTGHARGIVRDAIDYINAAVVPVLSVDLPSGLPASGSAPEGPVVQADITVAIGLPKISLVTHPGIVFRGELMVADIGFPRELTESPDLPVEVLDAAFVQNRLTLDRSPDRHKGSAGHLLFIGGFERMEGAIMLAAAAAFRTGIGLATLLTTQESRHIIAGAIPELMTRYYPAEMFAHGDNLYAPNRAEMMKNFYDNFFSEGKRYDALVIGPGLGRGDDAHLVFTVLMDHIGDYGLRRVLVDGDGLFHLASYIEQKRLAPDIDFICTPHFQEASRIIQKPVDAIMADRLAAARQVAIKTGSVVLLKGPASIVTNGDRSLVNTTGNPAMATAGSGDCLSGIIGALMLRDMGALDSAGIGAYLHGSAADRYLAASGHVSLQASDIVAHIRDAMLRAIFQI